MYQLYIADYANFLFVKQGDDLLRLNGSVYFSNIGELVDSFKTGILDTEQDVASMRAEGNISFEFNNMHELTDHYAEELI